jgi:hypothetical protein
VCSAIYIRNFFSVFSIVAFAYFMPPSTAFSSGVHEWFESRCGACHDHAGDLAREELTIANGVLISRKRGHDIRSFLPGHYGNPTRIEIAALYALMFLQVQAEGEFKARCAVCHIKAKDLARLSLVRSGNILRGRYSKRDMAEFLSKHGRIKADEVDFFMQLFLRLLP